MISLAHKQDCNCEICYIARESMKQAAPTVAMKATPGARFPFAGPPTTVRFTNNVSLDSLNGNNVSIRYAIAIENLRFTDNASIGYAIAIENQAAACHIPRLSTLGAPHEYTGAYTLGGEICGAHHPGWDAWEPRTEK